MSRFKQMIPQRANMATAAQLNEETVKAVSSERLKNVAINGGARERTFAMNELIRRTFEEAYGAGTQTTLNTMYAAACLALNRLYGFGAKRCLDVLLAMGEEMLTRIDSEEAAQEVFDAVGLKFVPDAPFSEEQFQQERGANNRLKKFREGMKNAIDDRHAESPFPGVVE